MSSGTCWLDSGRRPVRICIAVYELAVACRKRPPRLRNVCTSCLDVHSVDRLAGRHEQSIAFRSAKANVAAAVLTLDNGTVFDQQATSRRKGPLPNKPKKKSDGGLFTPSKHLDKNGDGRIMDTDAEYKLFDDMAQKLLELPEEERKGSLDLFTEMSMCDSCKDIKKQFEEMFPKINVNVSYKKVFQ